MEPEQPPPPDLGLASPRAAGSVLSEPPRAGSARFGARPALGPAAGSDVKAGNASSRFQSPSQNIWLNLEITFLIVRKRSTTNGLTISLASANHFPWTTVRLVFSLVAGTEFLMIYLAAQAPGCILLPSFPTSSDCQLPSHFFFFKAPHTQLHRILCNICSL